MPTATPVRIYNHIKDTPDARDFRTGATATEHVMLTLRSAATALKFVQPKVVDLRDRFPECFNQGNLGSCTGNAISALDTYVRSFEKLSTWVASRLFIYYNERFIENTVNDDAGAQIRDGLKSLATQGTCDEALWAYDDATDPGSKFTQRPSQECYDAASQHVALQYYRLDNASLNSLKACLDANACFTFGFSVYESFEQDEWTKTTCMMPIPNLQKEKCLGGHCVCCVGYSDAKQAFLIRNSWGKTWCAKEGGYFWLPFSVMISDLVSDVWTLCLAM